MVKVITYKTLMLIMLSIYPVTITRNSQRNNLRVSSKYIAVVSMVWLNRAREFIQNLITTSILCKHSKLFKASHYIWDLTSGLPLHVSWFNLPHVVKFECSKNMLQRIWG